MARVSLERFPFGKTFAVSLVDDTDGARLGEIVPAYACLEAHGLRSTKTVWPLRPTSLSGGYVRAPIDGDTLQEPAYRDFCRSLQAAGFEIAMHTASAGDSTRDRTLRAYDLFEAVFGHPPITNVMHNRNRENIYWGKKVTPNPLVSRLIALLEPLDFCGEVPDSPYYWGDICRARTRYVRLFETLRANTLAFDPATPYHDPLKPDVAWWFSASHGAGARLFDLLTPSALDRLSHERGAAIVQTYLRHYARGSWADSAVHPRFLAVARDLHGRSDAWVVPVATLLDRIRAVRQIEATTAGRELELVNHSDLPVDGLALRVREDVRLLVADGVQPPRRNSREQVCLGTLGPRERLRVLADRPLEVIGIPAPAPDYDRLAIGYALRVGWQFLHGRRKLVDNREHPWIRELVGADPRAAAS